MAAQDLIEKLVTSWLPDVEDVQFLTDKCDEFKITVPPQKASSSQYMQKLILRFLTSEDLENSADKGQSVWAKFFSEIGLLLKKGSNDDKKATPTASASGANSDSDSDTAVGGGGAKVKVKTDPDVDVNAIAPVAPLVTLHKMREFKISGTVDAGKPGTLQYVSLLSQISLGKSAKYTTPEIIYGVIRACPAASNFRTLLESNLDMDMQEFEKLLRSHFRQKSSDDILLELKSIFQEPEQSAYEFCCRAITLRDNLAKASLEEGDPWGDVKLKRRLLRTISTGLKQNSVRLELQPFLTEDSILNDWEFLDKVSAAEIREEERLGKVREKEAAVALLSSKKQTSSTGSKKQSATTCAVTSSQEFSKELQTYTSSVNTLAAKIDQLTTHSETQGKRIAELENLLLKLGSSGQQNNQNRRFVKKCDNCVAQNVSFCVHCFKCGSDGHRRSSCPN